MGSGETLIGSVQRALHLLDEVGASGTPVTAKALARQVGLNLPTAYHLLRTLTHEGYLQRVDGGYVLGEALTALGRRSRSGRAAWRARPGLQALRDELHAAAYLAVYDDGEINIVDIVDSPAYPRVDLWVGLQQSGHATSLGKCILGCLSEEEQADYLARHELADLTPQTVTNAAVLLRSIKEGGQVAVDRDEYLPGTACVGVPIRTPDIVGTVAVSVASHRVDDLMTRMPVLRRASDRIALALSAPEA